MDVGGLDLRISGIRDLSLESYGSLSKISRLFLRSGGIASINYNPLLNIKMFYELFFLFFGK